MDFFQEYKTVITIFHLLGVVIGFGAAISADFLFFMFVKNLKLSRYEIYTMGLVSRLVWLGLALIFISGLGLFLSNPSGYLSSSKFLLKMLVVTVITLNGIFLHFYVKPHLKIVDWESSHNDKKRRLRKIAFASGAISFNSWMLALILGSLKSIPLSVSAGMLSYSVFLVCVVVVSQVFERVFSRYFTH